MGKIKKLDSGKKPEDILQEQFDQLSLATGDKVSGRVVRIENKIKEFQDQYNLAETDLHSEYNSIFSNMFSRQFQNIGFSVLKEKDASYDDANRLLGEKKDTVAFAFEAFVYAKHIQGYKYSFLLMQHSLDPYPVKLIVDEPIATELAEEGTAFVITDEKEYIAFLSKLLQSKYLLSVVNKLYSY